MITEEEILKKITITKETSDYSLKGCLKSLSKEGLEYIYNFYDISDSFESDYHRKRTTRQTQTTYIKKEIPSQFLDEIRFWDEDYKEILVKLYNRINVDINYKVLDMAEKGYVYIFKKNDKYFVVLPDDLIWFLEDFRIIK